MKERKRYKNLMKHMDQPVDKAAVPFLPSSVPTLPIQDIEFLMKRSRAKLSQLENMLNLKLAEEQEMHSYCPTPSATPAASELQLHLDGASEQ